MRIISTYSLENTQIRSTTCVSVRLYVVYVNIQKTTLPMSIYNTNTYIHNTNTYIHNTNTYIHTTFWDLVWTSLTYHLNVHSFPDKSVWKIYTGVLYTNIDRKLRHNITWTNALQNKCYVFKMYTLLSVQIARQLNPPI